MIEDEMVGWKHCLNGHEFEGTLRVVMDREAWSATVRGGHKELETTEQLNLTVLICQLPFSTTGKSCIISSFISQ